MAKKKATYRAQKPKPAVSKLTPGKGALIPPVPTPAPVDTNYQAQLAQNQRDLELGLAAIQQGRNQLSYDTGFNAQGQLDPTNPFSKALQLERSFKQGQRATASTLGDRGQGYSSYFQNKIDKGAYNHSRDYDALRSGVMAGFNDLTQREQQARNGFGQGNVDAEWARLDRVAAFTPDDPGEAQYASVVPASLSSPGATKRKPARKGRTVQMARYAPPKPKRAKSRLI
jgi:hypothetical protein